MPKPRLELLLGGLAVSMPRSLVLPPRQDWVTWLVGCFLVWLSPCRSQDWSCYWVGLHSPCQSPTKPRIDLLFGGLAVSMPRSNNAGSAGWWACCRHAKVQQTSMCLAMTGSGARLACCLHAKVQQTAMLLATAAHQCCLHVKVQKKAMLSVKPESSVWWACCLPAKVQLKAKHI